MLSTEPCFGEARLGGVRIRFARKATRTLSIIAKQYNPSNVESIASDGLSSRRLRSYSNDADRQEKSYDDDSFGPRKDSVRFPPATLIRYHINEWLTSAYDASFLVDGSYTLAEMVSLLRLESDVMVYVGRLFGWWLMAFSFALLINVGNSVVCTGLPFCCGSFQGIFGFVTIASECGRECVCIILVMTFVVGAILSLPVCMVIIALAWIWARPLFAIALLVAAAIILILLHCFSRKMSPRNEATFNNSSGDCGSQQHALSKYDVLPTHDSANKPRPENPAVTLDNNIAEP